MKILVLAPQWPDPPRQGAAIRNLQVLLHLARWHRVTLLTFAPEGPVERSRLEAACERAEALPLPARSRFQRLRTLLTSRLPDMAWRLHSDAMHELVEELCSREPFDSIHVEGIEMAPYGLLARQVESRKHALERSEGSNVEGRVTYDAHNAEYLLQRRAFTTDVTRPLRWPRALYSLVQWWRLRRFEREVCLASRRVLTVSEGDAQALIGLAPDIAQRVTVLPNGVDPHYWSREATYSEANVPGGSELLVFDGTMDFRPNVDAVTWFARAVWPLVRAERPDARFFIVGRNPTPDVQALSRMPGVAVTGTVDDPRPWVAAATVYVVPMRMGGGVRLKVLQAMAMGCAIVSTPMGVEGINVRNERDILLARSASEFGQVVLSLLADPERRAALGRAARQVASEQYAWEKLLPILNRIYPRELA